MSGLGQKLPRRSLAGAAAMPPITDARADGWRGRETGHKRLCTTIDEIFTFRSVLSSISKHKQKVYLAKAVRKVRGSGFLEPMEGSSFSARA
jgi:hypothetical protein